MRPSGAGQSTVGPPAAPPSQAAGWAAACNAAYWEMDGVELVEETGGSMMDERTAGVACTGRALMKSLSALNCIGGSIGGGKSEGDSDKSGLGAGCLAILAAGLVGALSRSRGGATAATVPAETRIVATEPAIQRRMVLPPKPALRGRS